MARDRGHQWIAGADEVGRGCLFGPVYAAAVILNPDKPIRGLDDSKALTPERREVLNARIRERAAAWAVAGIDAYWIDRINIYHASRLALKRAVEALSICPDFLYVDALTLEVTCPQRGLIKGDARCASIAAASIVAKVERDQVMRHWDEIYPYYGLASNKGYSAPEHFAGLASHGPTAQHRFTFEPVRVAAGLGQTALFA